ncbi:MAG: hypothetical protein A2Y66_06985 [Nitrospirae bacterium RBG_13_41_22]|jgi:hypothetical protein|nr:MAG: hypothetical protein A2Y66_06985 [Nitrospirae bacterium RBG_13_41_22]
MKALDGTILKPYPGSFVHGVDLNNGYPCWNLSLSGRLYSPDFVAAVDRGVFDCHKSIRDTDIELIERGHMLHGAYTPRGLWFIQAAYQIRAGDYRRWSATSSAHFSDKEAEYISKMGAVELAFERRRREVAPQAASRLSCLYVADDNEDGRSHLKRMLGYGVHLLKVTIPLAIRVTRCDTYWFDAYSAEPNPDYIDKYWSGACRYEKRPTWEYLVDGMIEANDPEGMEYLRKHGVNIAPRPA